MKKPSMSETISAIAAKREAAKSASRDDGISPKSDIDMTANRDGAMPVSSDDAMAASLDSAKDTKRDDVKSIPHAVRGGSRNVKPEAPGTLPKMTLYAHADVLKAVRRIAVDDGVQAQVILRDALREYLAKRGHHFSDLSTGR